MHSPFFYPLFTRGAILLLAFSGLVACGGDDNKLQSIATDSSTSSNSDLSSTNNLSSNNNLSSSNNFTSSSNLSSSSPSLVVAPSELSYPSTLIYESPMLDGSVTVRFPSYPTVTGIVTRYSVSPALPEGLTFDTTTGGIDGVPITVSELKNYVVTAHNSAGSTSFTIAIVVNAPLVVQGSVPDFSYELLSPYHLGTLNTAFPFYGSVFPVKLHFSVSPDLPSGLTLDVNSGKISGIPTTATTFSTYVITAQNEYSDSKTSTVAFAISPTPAATTVTANYGVGKITLDWLPINGATYYRVMKTNNNASSQTIFFGDTENSYIDENFILLDTLIDEFVYTDNVTPNLTNILTRYLIMACNTSGCTGSREIVLDPK